MSTHPFKASELILQEPRFPNVLTVLQEPATSTVYYYRFLHQRPMAQIAARHISVRQVLLDVVDVLRLFDFGTLYTTVRLAEFTDCSTYAICRTTADLIVVWT